ncbi:hypothetical protein F511_40579 [Dorcoceras hygrometricum]|uniref:Uncharacterized protein n=1 Tax=Dorcoceras hygrometricum TaxID=472368 RepID=A0A2Z7D582_9LAMI|nr:hypothetical protein F511_40579 [Dorcoceras hygrometricum]
MLTSASGHMFTSNSTAYINFESVLMIPDHDGMLNMFKALEASGIRGFLGCESVLYEKELEQFFETALVQDFNFQEVFCCVYLRQANLLDLIDDPSHVGAGQPVCCAPVQRYHRSGDYRIRVSIAEL